MKKRKKYKLLAAAVVFFTAAFCVYSEISFGEPDLNNQNKVVFTVNQNISGNDSYSTGFMADVSTLSDVKILTCYPEKMEVLSHGNILQIRNRYGTARYSMQDSSLSWITRTSSIPSLSQRQGPQSISPDGKWICYVKKTSPSSGELVLKNASTLQETVLNKNCSFSWDEVPVLWNPDSNCVLYEKGGKIYFCSPKEAFNKIQMSEEFRQIGQGTIKSVYWQNGKHLVYINRDLVYKINFNELYTRGLYSNVVGTGTVSGRLPFVFDPYRDSFSLGTKGKTLLVIQNDRIITHFSFAVEGFEYLPQIFSKIITDRDGSVVSAKSFWTSDSRCILWVDYLGFTPVEQKTVIYQAGSELKSVLTVENASNPSLSPDGKKLSFTSQDTLFVYDLTDWRLAAKFTGNRIVSYAWRGNTSVFVGDSSTVHYWSLPESNRAEEKKLLFLSSAKQLVWNSQSAVLAEDSCHDGVYYEYNMGLGTWTLSSIKNAKDYVSVQNGKYRVFTGATPNKKFSDTLYVRTLSGKAVTKPLFPDTAVQSPSLKKISLVIDALDDASGLSKIISVLRKYNVTATFFINGEFIRRYPKETVQIAQSGYPCASMFFSDADLTAGDFIVTQEFIRRGLARNEDEFFALTGRELNLLWHAPFYKSSENIKKWGTDCGYRYIEAGRFSLDTVTLEDAAGGKPGYLSAGQMIDFYSENTQDKAVIPVSTGIAGGRRTDYLYEKLDLLIGTLQNQGFEFTAL